MIFKTNSNYISKQH